MVRNYVWQKYVVGLFFLLMVFTGCSRLKGISYYDLTTYKNLTEIKPQVLALYQSFGEVEMDSTELKAEIQATRLRLAQMYEYEKGKGDKNTPTADQIKIIQEAFEDHVKHRLKKDVWKPFDVEDFSENMADLFDIAIKTENSKNKK